MPHTPAQATVGQMIRISPELHAQVIAYAKDSGNTKAQAYRELLARGLKHEWGEVVSELMGGEPQPPQVPSSYIAEPT